MLTIDGAVRLIQRNDFTQPTVDFEPQDISVVSADLPIFCLAQVEILETIRPKRSFKIRVEGQIRFCKMAGRGFELPGILRDCQVLQEMKEIGLSQSCRVPTLEGLLSLREGSGVIRFLTNYIETSDDLGDLISLFNKVLSIPIARREKWGGQIKYIVEQLHGQGVIWGDASPRNVLIDIDDNAWLVDFGGGYNVDPKLMDTMEGDLEGLRAVYEFLKV